MLSLRMGRLEREGGVRCGSEDFLAMGLGSEFFGWAGVEEEDGVSCGYKALKLSTLMGASLSSVKFLTS
jgi:hypothetical protein